MQIREVFPSEVGFMVNPLPVAGPNGRQKHWRGRPVYRSCNHISRQGVVLPHPGSFLFVVKP